MTSVDRRSLETMRHSSEEIVRLPNGIELCFDTFGEPDDPALLLVMGLSGPMIWWHSELCSQLAERGFFVIRFDNRDVGRSTRLSDRQLTRGHAVRAFLTGSHGTPPYTLRDMADDAFGLLDHLQVSKAHVTGISMGGMIAQTMALAEPDRVLSLVSIMSTTGGRRVGWQHPRIFPLFLRERATSREDYVRQAERVTRLIGSPGYTTPPEEGRALAEATYDRGLNPEGVMRQIHAVLAQPDRSKALRQIRVPTLVIHGLHDRMIHVSGGRATARAIPGSELILVPGMGHDLPPELWPMLVDGIVRTARRAGLP